MSSQYHVKVKIKCCDTCPFYESSEDILCLAAHPVIDLWNEDTSIQPNICPFKTGRLNKNIKLIKGDIEK